MKTKNDTARDPLLETKVLPAQLEVTGVSLNRFFNILQQTRNRSNKQFRFLENLPTIANKRTQKFFLKQKSKSNATLFEIGTHFQLPLEKKRRRTNLKKSYSKIA